MDGASVNRPVGRFGLLLFRIRMIPLWALLYFLCLCDTISGVLVGVRVEKRAFLF